MEVSMIKYNESKRDKLKCFELQQNCNKNRIIYINYCKIYNRKHIFIISLNEKYMKISNFFIFSLFSKIWEMIDDVHQGENSPHYKPNQFY